MASLISPRIFLPLPGGAGIFKAPGAIEPWMIFATADRMGEFGWLAFFGSSAFAEPLPVRDFNPNEALRLGGRNDRSAMPIRGPTGPKSWQIADVPTPSAAKSPMPNARAGERRRRRDSSIEEADPAFAA